jgi:hypothetical protein
VLVCSPRRAAWNRANASKPGFHTALACRKSFSALLWLTSVIAGHLKLPFHVAGFWPAFWGAIIVGLVSWLLHLLIGDKRRPDHQPPPVRVVRVR